MVGAGAPGPTVREAWTLGNQQRMVLATGALPKPVESALGDEAWNTATR